MGASSNHEKDQEWDLVEDLGYNLSGSLDASPSLTAQNHGSHPPSCRTSVTISKAVYISQRNESFSRPHYYSTVVPFDMTSNLTPEEIKKAREANLRAKRVKSLAWTFAGVPKSDAHHKASSKRGGPVPHEFAEDDRERLRAGHLAWMFGGAHMSLAHENWDNLSPEDQARVSKDLECSPEQVG